MTGIAFDSLDFVKKAKEFGVNEEFAEYQARQFEQINEIIKAQNSKFNVLEAKELATKGDVRESELRLQKEIKSLEVKLMTIYGSGFIIILGVLAKGFHWF